VASLKTTIAVNFQFIGSLPACKKAFAILEAVSFIESIHDEISMGIINNFHIT
jgi:hypothetical protein